MAVPPNLLTRDPGPVIQVDRKGRRRYVSRVGTDSPYTYALPNNGYTGTGYSSSLGAYDMSKYSRTYDYPRTYDTGSRTRDVDTPYSSSRYGLSSAGSSYGIGSPSTYDSTSNTGTSRYNTGTRSYDISSGNYDNNTRRYDFSTGTSDTSSRLGSYSSRYGHHGDLESMETKQRSIGARPPHQRYKLMDDDSYAVKSSPDVKIDELRSRRHRRGETERDKDSEQSRITGGYELYKNRKKNENQESFELERPVFSSVEGSSDLRSYSFRSRDRHSDSRVTSQPKESEISSGSSTQREKLRNYSDNSEMLAKEKIDRGTVEHSSRRHFRKSSDDDKVQTNGVHPKQSNVSLHGKDVALTVDSSEVAMETTGLSGWRRRKLEREQRERAKSEREESEKNIHQSESVSKSDNKSSLDDDKTQTETRRRNIEKIERPKSVDADTIKNILLRSDSPLLRSRYREAVRKRDELQLSSEKSSVSEIADIEKGNDQDRKIDSNLETTDKSSLRKAQSDDRALYSKSQESKTEKSSKENTLKTSVGHSRGDNSDLLSRKESEHGVVKRSSRNEQKEDRHPEAKRKILVSRSRVDNLRDSVKQSQEKDFHEASRRKLEAKDDPRTSGLKTEKVTDVDKQTEPERALYSRRLLSSTSSKDEKVADKTDKSVRKSEQESDNKNAASTEKLSRRAAHARRAQHHRQEGSSLVKHMSDLLFEDPKPVRGERQSQDEAKKDELKQESRLKTDKDKHLSKESSAEKSEISIKKPQSYLQEKDRDSVKKSSNENQANERPRKLSAERVSEKLQGSVQLTLFSARKEDIKGERISSESRKLNTKLLGSHDKKVSETETKTKESKGTEKISEKPHQIYGRAKTTDISSLKKEKEDKKEDEQKESIKKALDDLSSLGTTTMANLSENTQLSRAERIAKYKEERKRQLAYISNKFGNLGQDSEAKDIVPSLFHAAREESKENGDSLSRSRSLREESPQKYLSPVLRSKSLREDLSPKKNVDVTEGKDECVPVSTGKKTSVMSIDESGKEMPLTEKIAHTRKLFEVKSVDEEKDIDTKQVRHKSLTDTIGSEFGTSPRRKSSNEETSLDKLKNRYLFGADFSDAKERKTSENAEAKEGKSDKDERTKIKSFDTVNVLQELNVDKVDDAHAKRRRQLPSIPMVLGEISSVEESEFKTSESELVGKSLDSGKNLSHSQDLSSVSSFKSSVSSSPSAKSSLSSVSSVSPFSAKQFAFEEPKKEVAKSDKPSQEVKTKQEFLSPTSMKVQSEKTYSIPQDTERKMSHEKTKSSQKTNYKEEYKSQSSSGSHVTTETNVDSQKTTFDTKDILAKFKELENLQFDSADNQKPEEPSDILDSDKLDKGSEETVAGLKSNKVTKTLSQEISKDQGKDQTETPKTSDTSASNPKSTKIRRRSPLRSRIPLSPSRKVVDQEKEEFDKKDTKSSKDDKKGKVSEVKSTKTSIVSDSNSGPPKTADLAKTEKVKADTTGGKDVFGGLKVTATSSQKEKFVSEVKEIEISKKSKSVDVMEAPKSEKVITSSEQAKDDLAKVISSSESKIQKSKGETVSKELKSKDDKTEDISKPVSHKQSLEVKSQTSEKQDSIQMKQKVETVSKGDLQSDIRAPKGEVTKPSRRLSDGTKEKITSTTSIEIKSVEKPRKEKPDLKSVEKTNASKSVSSKEIPKEDVPNSAKSKLPSTDTKSSEVTKPTVVQKSELEIKKVSSESEKSQKQKAYSSDEGGKSGKVKSSRSRQLKSTSEKSSKSGGLQRSKTITEKELKSPQVLKRGTKEGSSATRSKQEIRSILSRSPDANLDDLLLQNVEYLSDIETKEPWAVKRETSSKGTEEEQVKAKRFQRKKKLQRSKSESDSGRIESKERFSDEETEEFKKGQVTTGKEEKPVLSSASATIQDQTKDRLATDANKDNKPTSIDNSSKENVSEKSHAPPHLQESAVQPDSYAQDSQSPLTTQEKLKDSIKTSKSDPSRERKTDSDHAGEVTVVDKSSYSLSEQDLKGMKEADKSIDSDSTTMSEESSGRSPRSDSEKKKRKDKSSIRKSSLNVTTDGATDVGRRGLTVDEKRKAGARSPLLSSSSSSSLTKDESTDHVTTKTPVFTPNHLNEHGVTSTNISNRHGNSISNSSEQQHAQSTPRSSNNILDSILPSKFSIPSKVSTVISKFSSDGSQEKTEAVKKETDNKSPRRIPRRNNFSSLLQKFSGSEQSSSENEQPSSQKKFGLQRQEAYTLTSSDESERRRTPERTQSLRVKKSPSPEILKDGKGIQRSGSFKSDFMKRRYSPEPENRIPLPEEKEMATPTPELAAILNRRQKVVTDQQIEGAEKERERITSKNVEREEFRPAPAEVEEVIADSEVASVLKARRKETDSASDTDTKTVTNKDHSDLHNGIKTSQRDPKESHSFKSELGIAQIPKQSCVKSTQSTPLIHNINTEKPIDKDVQSAKFASEDSKLGISAIDTSLEVLSAVSKDISVTDNDNEPPKQTDLELSLTKVKVDSDEDVAKFITDVQKSKMEKKEDVSSLSVSEREKKTIKSERISPDRSIRSKVSPLKEKVAPKEASSSSSGLRRAESYRSKEVEKPKGILKRTSSMKKGGIIVDAELAGILQQRRQQQGDDEEEEQEITVSAKKDIDETRRREKELHPFSSSDEEETTHMSIQERIFHMKNRLDESKSCPITPKSISGSATPKLSYKGRTGSLSSGFQQGSDENTASHVSGEQLIEKLSDLADKSQASDSVVDKRKKFQQRSRDDWRTRTQPVTLEEIHEADSLQSVLSFRREVLKKASTNVFENIQKHSKSPVIGAKSEFPQPYKGQKVRRSRSERHKTLPVTAAELSAIPEGESVAMATLRHKSEILGKRDSKADSGILSGSSDMENYLDSTEKESHTTGDSLRSLSLEMDISEDDPATLSVSAKASMFTKLEEKTKFDKPKSSASGAKRYIDRKKRERSRTQPVTEDEVKTAAEIADGNENEAESTIDDTSNRENAVEKNDEDNKETDDDLSRRSLAEKVKLFSSLKEQEKQQQKAEPPPVIKRRNRKLASRFNTQPITIEEVEKAAQYRVSPLAMSLVKPPDPEMLKGLSVSAQREIMAQHAEVVMSQPSSRSSSRHSSTVDLTQDVKSDSGKGTSKKKEEITKDLQDVKKLLREEQTKQSEKDKSKETTDPKSPLKQHDVNTHEELKRIMLGKVSDKDSENKTAPKAPETNGTTKEVRKDEDNKKTVPRGSSEDDPMGKQSELRGILKKEGSFEVKKEELSKSIPKKTESKEREKNGEVREKPKVEEVVATNERVRELKTERTKKEKSPSPDRTSKVSSGACSSVIRRRGRDPKQPERYLTQPTDSTPERSPETTRKIKYGQVRHKTQPVTPEEKREAENSPEGSVSIKNRLEALQKSGEEDWKKRISKQLELETKVDVKLRDKKRNLDLPRPSSIADRLNLLENSQGGWRERVEENDAKRFTVAHKLAGQVEESPLVRKLRERTKKDSESESGSELTSPSTPTREWAKIPLPKTIISGPPVVDEPKPEAAKAAEEEKKEEKEKPPVKVTVPSMDDEHFKSFFSSRKDITEITSEKVEVTMDDINEIFIIANDILPSTRKIRPKRKHTAKSKNPLKTMMTTVEVKTEYEEIDSGVAEKELRRLHTSKIAKDAGFAQAALAGLASKENFAKVELRKTADVGSGKTLLRLDPYKDIMLLHVKGRRRTQVRLVEPCAKSINSGDCYLLVTPDKIINWVGEFSNVIEKAKAADVASFILQKRDMGCKAGSVETVEEKRQHLGAGKKFWQILGGLGTISSAGPPEEDELYENHIVETNMVYKLQNNSLTPYQEYWGLQPKYEMLKKDEVLVFDFGSELYVWQGKSVKPDQRKMGVKLSRQLWEKGYDYEACDINPISPLTTEEFGGPPSKSNERPSWALFGKVNQNMETILFREKFSDWPDTSRLIKVKSTEEIAGSRNDLSELKPYDASLMIPVNTNPVSLVLEGSHVGRGVNWSEDMEGFIREQNIVTLGVKVWHVLEYDHFEVPESSYGQFHDGDTYVVRWQYMITNKGAKDLKGTQSRRSLVGRERCAYFFWQGKSSTINEKGASALMTVELDEERGPQVRVDEGKEMPCFLNLFGGRMIIHVGKREEEATNTQGPWRCYCVRSDYENELCLLEVPKAPSQLRSHSSLLMLNVNSGLLYIWHGCKSPPHTRKLAKVAAKRLKEKCPLEVGMKEDTLILISEMDENSEKPEFWSFMGVQAKDTSHYHSLLSDPSPYNHTLRMFYMSSVSGVFEVHENLNPSRTPDLVSPFPFLQSDLYKASQPALFLVDNNTIVYLWHGWWPEGDHEIENIQTGSAKSRFGVDRKCAIDTAMQYCKLKNPENPPKAVAVHAGLEPLEFTNLFPFWDVDETARSLNLKDGKEEGEITPLEEILEKVTQTRYTYEELLEDPLPEGVDPLRLESYLDDEEFEEIIELNREEFYSLPGWKQSKIKQQVGLF